ncbi:MAG: YwaF family protein, partial [Clostridia bacterium]|nr:YwaF family protein [Clostridia bacterium]
FCKNILKHIGDVFLATGGMIAGIMFLLCPNTSLTTYPIFHYISLQSFILHGAMVYLGILVNITDYIEIRSKDIIYYAGLTLILCVIAYIFNTIFDSNLMFISKDFPGTPMSILYSISSRLFTPIMIVLQATVPFYIVYGIKCLEIKCMKNKEKA